MIAFRCAHRHVPLNLPAGGGWEQVSHYPSVFEFAGFCARHSSGRVACWSQQIMDFATQLSPQEAFLPDIADAVRFSLARSCLPACL